MIYTGKPFQRRPWERGDDGLVRHFDRITVKDLAPPASGRAFYFCLHTTCVQLAENKIPCDSLNGWVWPEFYLENFTVESTKDVTGVHLMDGIVPGIKFGVTLRDGKFVNMLGVNPLVSANYINFSDFNLVRLKCDNCQGSKIEIHNCTIGCLRIFDCDNLHIELLESQVRRVELCNTEGITFSGAVPELVELPCIVKGVVGSFSVIVSVDGKLYRGDAANVLFREYKAP